jgi:hypothetical protein
MEFDWDCERSCVGGIGAVLEGGVKERDGLCGITGGEVADLEGSEREGSVRDTSVMGGMGGDLVGAEAGNCTGDSSFLGGVGAVLEGAATAASTGDSFLTGGMGAALEGAQCTDDSSFVGGTGAILVGASQDFTTTSSFVGGSGAILSGGAIFGTGAGCSTSSSLSSLPSGVPHLDWIPSSSNSAASSSKCPAATLGFTRSSSFWNGVVGEHCASLSISSKEKAPESMFLSARSGLAGTAGGARVGGDALSVAASVSTGLDFFQKAKDIFSESWW